MVLATPEMQWVSGLDADGGMAGGYRAASPTSSAAKTSEVALRDRTAGERRVREPQLEIGERAFGVRSQP